MNRTDYLFNFTIPISKDIEFKEKNILEVGSEEEEVQVGLQERKIPNH